MRRPLLLPEGDETFRLTYEGLHHIEGPWCTINVYRRDGFTIIVATDECDDHHDCSITNRIERVMFLAWQKLREPWPCFFVEHYRDSPVLTSHCDLVAFDMASEHGMKLVSCWSAGKIVGPQFHHPDWKPLREPNRVAAVLMPAPEVARS